MIQIVLLSAIIVFLLYLATATDSESNRLNILAINGETKDSWRILILKTWLNRRAGLLNSFLLPPTCGILIATPTVHTKGMLFAIDIVSINQEGKVLAIETNIQPNTLLSASPTGTRSTLELMAGATLSLNLKIGDYVSFGVQK